MARPERDRSGAARSALSTGLVLACALTASCSNNDQIVSPATDFGIYGIAEVENHVPAPGALVLLESYVDPISPYTPHEFFTSVLTIPDGGFGTGPVPAGRYLIFAGYPKAVPSPGATFDSLVSYESVTVTDPTSFRIPMRLTLRPPATIVGRVITNTPGWMYVYAVGSGGSVSGSTLDASGQFTLAGVPQGTWRLMAYDLTAGVPVLAVNVGGVVTRFGETTHVREALVPSP